jgi:hypothetical protein
MDFESWPIIRSKPRGKTYGRAIQLFINNLGCHLTTVDVYADGAIDCWGFVDRSLFTDKLKRRWVVTAPAADQYLAVHSFGQTGVADGCWQKTAEDIAQAVDATIRSLNPRQQKLFDMHGSDTQTRDGARYAKLGLADAKPFRVDARGLEVAGDHVPVLRVTADGFELTRLIIYRDGACQLGGAGRLFRVEQVPALYDAGRLCNKAPAGSRIAVPGLGEFRNTTDFGGVSVKDRICEIQDRLGQLTGRPSVIETCARCFDAYEQAPSANTLAALRRAYEAVPQHQRIYCGDMDTRDTAIRAVLYGDADD